VVATYKQIQKYVRNTSRVYVATCWIAHVKEICGLNPIPAKNRINNKIRVNPCPTNRILNIKNALKHFKMI
jgi:hypothetical protein